MICTLNLSKCISLLQKLEKQIEIEMKLIQRDHEFTKLAYFRKATRDAWIESTHVEDK